MSNSDPNLDNVRYRPKFWHKLSVKVSVGVVGILGLIIILIGRFVIDEQRKYMFDQLNDYGVETAEFVAEISIVPIRKFSIYQLESFVSRLEKGQLITYCEIYDAQDNPLVHQTGQMPRVKKIVPANILIFERDIVDDDQVIGRVEIGIDPGPVLARIEEISRYIQSVFIAELVFIALALSLFIHKTLVSPFIRLTQITEDIAVGKFTTSDQASRDDEIGWLAKSINSMSHKLKESYQNLERLVGERTSKLEETNIQLADTINSLAEKNQQTELIKEYVEELQSCESKQSTAPVLIRVCEKLFVDDHGWLSALDSETEEITVMGIWGDGVVPELPDGDQECQTFKSKQMYSYFKPESGEEGEECAALQHFGFCIPVIVQGNMSGALHVSVRTTDKNQFAAKQKLAENLIQTYSLFLNNLELRRTLQQKSVQDPLTGLYNRRFMEEALRRETARAVRGNFSIGIIMADVDYFKRFNDSYGHDVGDTVLRKLASLLQEGVRGEDVVCRYGGEEFILILPNTGMTDTMQRAEDLRHQVEKNMVMNLQGEDVVITISLGVSVYTAGENEIDDILKKADLGLYAAKEAGRNRVGSVA